MMLDLVEADARAGWLTSEEDSPEAARRRLEEYLDSAVLAPADDGTDQFTRDLRRGLRVG